MTQSRAHLTGRTATARTLAAHALDHAAGLSTIVVPPFAAQGAAELLRERTAASLAGLRAGAAIIQLALLHPAIELGGE